MSAPEGTPDDVSVPVLDAVTIALRRAGYAGVAKSELQEAAGAGTGDMRRVLEHLFAQNAIEDTGGGYRWRDDATGEGAAAEIRGLVAGADPDAEALIAGRDPDEDDDEHYLPDDDGVDPEEAAAARAAFGASQPAEGSGAMEALGFTAEGAQAAQRAAQGDGGERYSATIALVVEYPVIPEAERTDDAIALEGARDIAEAVRRIVAERYPGVTASAYVAGLEVFQRTRTVPVR